MNTRTTPSTISTEVAECGAEAMISSYEVASKLIKMIPVVQVIAASFSCLHLLKQAALKKELSKAQRATKIGFSASFLGAAIATVLAPVALKTTIIGISGLFTVKSLVEINDAYQAYKKVQMKLQDIQAKIKSATIKKDWDQVESLTEDSLTLQVKAAQLKQDIIKSTAEAVMDTAVTVGTILLFTPHTALIGAAIILGAVILKTAAKLLNFFKKKSVKNNIIKANKNEEVNSHYKPSFFKTPIKDRETPEIHRIIQSSAEKLTSIKPNRML